MAAAAERRAPWNQDELDIIVADYFAMLNAELAGEPYVKSEHRSHLVALIGRSEGSIEFKHQNISAVLEELGLPWIWGYKPKRNFQNALFDAIERYLVRHGLPDPARINTTNQMRAAIEREVFVAPPPPRESARRNPEPLERLIRQFDPVERDLRNRRLGEAGEKFVLELERQKLMHSGKREFAEKVRWVSKGDGDGAGYDILSFAPTGQERLIEVKTTNGSARTPFYLTRNEKDVASAHEETWRLYRVHLFAQSPRVFTVRPPLEKVLHLQPTLWLAHMG